MFDQANRILVPSNMPARGGTGNGNEWKGNTSRPQQDTPPHKLYAN